MNKQELKIGIFEVVDIDKIKPSSYNRDIDENHVKKQGESLNDLGWAGPLKVDNQYNLMDGHHKYKWCIKNKQLKVPVYRMWWLDGLSGKEVLSVILKLNAKTLNWKPEMLLSRYGKLDNDYKIADDTQQHYGIKNMPPSTLIYAFFNEASSSIKFREGRCRIVNLHYAKRILNELSRLRNEYGDSMVQGSPMREIARQSHVCFKRGEIYFNYLIYEYEDMLKSNHPYCNNIKELRCYLDKKIKRYAGQCNI